MRVATWCMAVSFWFAVGAVAADFASKGGPAPANFDELSDLLRQDPYDMELLISFGTSKGGSAGHVALAIRDQVSSDDIVYSANFYADRESEHEKGFYTDDLMTMIPKKEYPFGTMSSLGDAASFGLDFGEIYKRTVVGVRVYGVPSREKEAFVAYFKRINADYHNRAKNTEYHDGEVVYGYLNLNCAKTIGSGFKYGAGYKDLDVKGAPVFSRRKVLAAAKANIPTEMAMKLLKEWNERGYGMDVVLYRKYDGSNYVDPNEEKTVAFNDLPNRFPSFLSLDFSKEQDQYRDFDNLFAMYVLYNMGKYRVKVNDETKLLEIEKSKSPMPYPTAAALASKNARSDSRRFLGGAPFRPSGKTLGGSADNANLFDLSGRADRATAPPAPARVDTGSAK